jgi:hypothetical protein
MEAVIVLSPIWELISDKAVCWLHPPLVDCRLYAIGVQLQLLMWQVYTVNEAGLIQKQEQQWSISAWTALKQSFTPSFGQ